MSPTTSPSVSFPAAPPPMTSPASAFTSAWMEPLSTSQATYKQSTSMKQTSKIYFATSSGDSHPRQPKMNSMKHVDDYPLSRQCRRPATRSFSDSIGNGHSEWNDMEHRQ